VFQARYVFSKVSSVSLVGGRLAGMGTDIVTTGAICRDIDWKNHIDHIIPKLSAACYMVRQMCYNCNNDTLRSIYFHSIASYGIILGGNSSYSKKIFTSQKRIIRIMVGAHPRTSCRRLFKKLEILTLPS